MEGDLERIFELAEEHETKGQEIESQVREQEAKVRFSKNNLFFLNLWNFQVKETEAITIKNADEEEKFENKITKLQDEFKQADTRWRI